MTKYETLATCRLFHRMRCELCQDDDDDETTACVCKTAVCKKCMVGNGDSSAGRRHHHRVCEQQEAYEELIAFLRQNIAELKQEKKSLQTRIDELMKILSGR